MEFSLGVCLAFLRNSLHYLEMLALDTPYSVAMLL